MNRPLLAGLLFGDSTESGTEVVFECRRCSATLSSADDRCDYCGTSDVVRYEIR